MRNSFGTFRKTGFGMRGGKRHAMAASATLNLTPMVDMFTIILVFLIKSYSVTPAFLTPTAGIDLAITQSEQAAPDKAVLIVGKNGILIEGKLVVPFKEGVVDAKLVKEGALPVLRQALEAIATKTKFIAEKNSSVTFTGTLIVQADKDLPFESMKPILKTAGLAGYSDIKFAGLSQD